MTLAALAEEVIRTRGRPAASATSATPATSSTSAAAAPTASTAATTASASSRRTSAGIGMQRMSKISSSTPTSLTTALARCTLSKGHGIASRSAWGAKAVSVNTIVHTDASTTWRSSTPVLATSVTLSVPFASAIPVLAALALAVLRISERPAAATSDIHQTTRSKVISASTWSRVVASTQTDCAALVPVCVRTAFSAQILGKRSRHAHGCLHIANVHAVRRIDVVNA